MLGFETENAPDETYARLRSLDEETQRRIAKKYYNGKRPWREQPEEVNGKDVQKGR